MLETMVRQLEELYPQIVSWRRDFHMHPELSFQEKRTPQRIAELLQSFGVEVRTGVGGRGVVGKIHGGKPGKTVALRADFDALPIEEEADVSYRSTVPGAMHACGHDGHTATLLAVAKVLSEHRRELPGNVVLFHQFAEELVPGGAKPMIEDGCLDGVDAIFGTHLWSGYPVGKIAARSGPVMAIADEFEVVIRGKGGHGAMPHETIDAIVVASQLVQQLQQLVSRKVNPLDPAVVTVGSFHAGEACNVIAEEARLSGTVRTFDAGLRDLLVQDMETMIQGVCQASGATYSMDYRKGYPAVVNHERETRFVQETVAKVLGAEAQLAMEPLMPGEDFAYYLECVPGCFFFTGARNEALNAMYPHHHPKFNIDEQAMLYAAKMLLALAWDYLQDPRQSDSS